jgi:competence protein ComEC
MCRITIFTSAVWLPVAALLAAMAFANKSTVMLGAAFVAGLLLGCCRTTFTVIDMQSTQSLNGQTLTVSGVVFEDPDIAEDGSFAIKIHKLQIDGRVLLGNIYVGKLTNQDIKRSDRVTLKGTLASGFGSFSAAMWRPQIESVDRPTPGDLARRVRDWFGDIIRQFIDVPEADLGLGYLLGQRRGLPDSMVEMLKVTGLTHIVVASGYNLTILVRFSRRLFAKVSRFAALFFALILVVCFIMTTGVSPSMIRAGLVSALSLLAWYYGRKFHPVNLLVLVATTTLLLNPSYVFDLGWLLSFGSFVGVMVFAPLISAYFVGSKKPNFMVQILFETVSAQLLVLPILVYFFGQVSLVSVAANLLVLPTIPIAMLLVFLTGIGWLAAPLMGGLATLLLSYHLAVMNYFGSFEWAMLDVHFGIIGVVVCYALILTLGIYLSKATGYKLRESNVVE